MGPLKRSGTPFAQNDSAFLRRIIQNDTSYLVLGFCLLVRVNVVDEAEIVVA